MCNQSTRTLHADPRNGEFLGVVLVGLGVSYFQSIYNSTTPLHDQSFALLHPDGTVLVRYPTAIDRSNQKMPAGSPWYKAVAAGGGHYWSPGFFDGQARLVAVHPLHDYPPSHQRRGIGSCGTGALVSPADINRHRHFTSVAVFGVPPQTPEQTIA